MFRLAMRRFGGSLLVLVAVSFLTFALLDLAPGDAAQVMVGETAGESQLARLRRELGLEGSLLSRYLNFATGVFLRGDLGRSLVSGRPVAALVLSRFSHTAALALVAIALAFLLGLAAGSAAAARPGSYLDAAIISGVTLGLAAPSFWLALLLLMVFSLRLGWLPVFGSGTPAHLILPVFSLGLPTAAVVARLVRASLLDVQGAEYVRTARAKGLTPAQVWRGHALRNALVPVVTLMSLHLGHLLGGTFVIETIFGWPGLGRLVVQAIFERDYPVILAAALLLAAIYQALNLAADLAHAWLDPRVGSEAI